MTNATVFQSDAPLNMEDVHLGDPNCFKRLRVRKDQTDPAGGTAGKSLSGSNTLLKRFVSEYIATSATISMMFASV
jgi:hypothetical protein